MPTLINNNLTSSYEGTDSHELSASFEAIKWPKDMAPSHCPIHFTNELEVAASPETIWSPARGPRSVAHLLPRRRTRSIA
jgi:hypothetical protein